MDSGVETGNDSNDSLVTQHTQHVDNIVALCLPDPLRSCVGSKSNEAATLSNRDSTINRGNSENQSSEATSSQSLSSSDSGSSSTCRSLISVKDSQTLHFDHTNMIAKEYNMEHLFVTPSINLNFSALTFAPEMVGPQRNYRRKYPTIPKRRDLFEKLKRPVNECKMRLAAVTNNIEMMKRLLDAGVSPNNCDEQGQRTPLHMAASRGYTEMVKLLLQYGANPNQQDCIGNTPLHLAAVTGKMSVVTLLLTAGTDVLSSDCHGYNPLQLAQTKLRVLQHSKGADMNRVKDEVRNIIGMLLVYLQKQKDARKQVESLTSLCSQLSLTNTTDQLQDDMKNLLANINSLSLSN